MQHQSYEDAFVRTMSLTAIADAVRGDIIRAMSLQDVAIGLSQSRLVSQLMAKRAKPNGVCICEPGAELQTLSAIESKLLPGISSRNKERIGAYGLKCVGQIRHLAKKRSCGISAAKAKNSIVSL